MNKYVKIEGYPNQYFLLIEDENIITEDFENSMNNRMKKVIGKELTSNNSYPSELWHSRFKCVNDNRLDYKRLLRKYKYPLLIREIGSFMFLTENLNILETRYSNDFPNIEKEADIIICENDERCEIEWLSYLNKRFKNKSIKVLNFFNERSLENIKNNFKGSEYITFSTTFSNVNWFEKLLKCITEQKIIGYCHDYKEWDKINLDKINIEIIKELDNVRKI